jgi:hypothetical protein
MLRRDLDVVVRLRVVLGSREDEEAADEHHGDRDHDGWQQMASEKVHARRIGRRWLLL